ncbi:MAG: DUF1127 domain-containing protein [Kiloniellales bacterium]
MNIWFDAIARAGGIEAASSHPVSHARPATVRRNRAAPGFVRRLVTDIGGAVPSHTFQALRRWHKRGKAIRELSALNNRTLKDIGIARGSIRESVDALFRAEAEGGTL